MKTTIFVCAILFLVNTTANSQSKTFGIKLGLTVASPTLKYNPTQTEIDVSGKSTFNAGLSVNVLMREDSFYHLSYITIQRKEPAEYSVVILK